MAVLVLGAFDVLHWGHLEFLGRAGRFGRVTVGLSSDEFLASSKRRPILTFAERRRALELLGCQVVERPTSDARPIFEAVRPDFFVCGSDWATENHLASAELSVDLLNALNITLVYTPRSHSMSSTEIIRRVREEQTK